jgi:SAM-dependent methyltransferase
VSVTVVPTNEVLTKFYSTYNVQYKGGGSSEGKNLQRYARRYLDIVQRYAKKGILVDVGSSTNPFPSLAASEGFDVTTLDYIRPADLSNRVSFIQGSIDDEDIAVKYRNQFDLVTAWAVAEHLPRPANSAKIMACICRPGGMLFLSTPEIGTFLTNHSVGRSSWFYPPEHLNLLSPAAVSKIFAPYNCTVVKWGRLELTPARFLARYGIGVFEATIGILIKLVLPKKWRSLRDSRVHKFSGITYFVLRKNH